MCVQWKAPVTVHPVITGENMYLCSRDKWSSQWSGLTIGGRVNHWARRGRRSRAFTRWLPGDLAPRWRPSPSPDPSLEECHSTGTDSLEAGGKLQLLRILTTFSTTLLPFYQCNNAVSMMKHYLQSHCTQPSLKFFCNFIPPNWPSVSRASFRGHPTPSLLMGLLHKSIAKRNQTL